MNKIKENFKTEIKKVETRNELIEIKNKYFSKKGIITELMQEMKNVENKKEYGEKVNNLKTELFKLYEEKNNYFLEKELESKLIQDKIDVTLETPNNKTITKNILLKTRHEIESFFSKKGFEIAYGQEIETDHYNFEALNLDKNHPARDMQDTFYVNNDLVLRTHTSNIQSRILEKYKNQELKIICSGKVYRRDEDDATHSHQFMQLEGFNVVRIDSPTTANLKDLKTILTEFVRYIFENDELSIRMRPSYFPFTEPSVEVDVTCSHCLGKGCSFCKKTGYIEILGAGIINKKVLEIAGYNADEFVGYAFGIGIERICLLKYGIDDIRELYLNDHRFLEQF